MKHIKKIVSMLLIFVMVSPMLVGCTNIKAESSVTKEEQAQKKQEEIEKKNRDQIVEKLEEKDSKGVVSDGNGWTLWDDNQNLTSGDRNASGENAIVSTGKYEASQAGLQILKAGGNAIDAAVAIAFALSVVEPNASGLGGGGYMLIRTEEDENVFIDFRECAPEAANPYMWVTTSSGKVVDNENRHGGKSIGIPGEVAGLIYAFENYGSGKLTLKQLVTPAINLAQNGFYVTPTLYHDIESADKKIPENIKEGHEFLRKENGELYQVGDLWKNEDMVKTLNLIAEKGKDGFYKGEIADKIVEMSNKYGGILTKQDLENYEVRVSKPVEGTYRGYKILSAGLPSSGGAHVIQSLNILENFDMSKYGIDSSERIHLLSETFKMVYKDRAEYMGDPEYVDVPLNGLLNKEYASKLADKIDLDYSQNYEADDPWTYEHQDTTHFSIGDKDGNMVSVTQSINWEFGSGVMADGYGFVLNNEVEDFDVDPNSPNCVDSNKEPMSSMSPTIILNEDDSPFMILGSPGGARIIPIVTQVISNVIDYNLPVQEAINEPRVYDNADNKLVFEKTINKDLVYKLMDMGHRVSIYQEDSKHFGGVQAVMYNKDNIAGGADERRDGKVLGY